MSLFRGNGRKSPSGADLSRLSLAVKLSAIPQGRGPAVLAHAGKAMASKTQAPPEVELPEKTEGSPDYPLLDLSDAVVKRLVRTAKKRGYVTHDQVSSVLGSDAVSSEQIEDVLAML